MFAKDEYTHLRVNHCTSVIFLLPNYTHKDKLFDALTLEIPEEFNYVPLDFRCGISYEVSSCPLFNGLVQRIDVES